MAKGSIGFILHAHLPFVRHPEYEHFMEEDWLFEAISETYLPVLRMLNRLSADNIPFRLTFSVSPTLSSMLTDELLTNRYINHLKQLIDLGYKEKERLKNNPKMFEIVDMYHSMFKQNLDDFVNLYRKNILWGFRNLEKEGFIDIITTAATHAFLPLYSHYPQVINAQIQTALISHGRNFGTRPKGFWLPEMGYEPGIEEYLKANDIEYFFTAAHGIILADEKPGYGVYAPLKLPDGLYAFGRDFRASDEVWSKDYGYPSDKVYREFYRDIGYDLPMDYIRPFIQENEVRGNTGYKYYAITGATDKKELYNINAAKEKVKEHALKFVENRLRQFEALTALSDFEPYFVLPFDAELFGHWWYEGVEWLEQVLRIIHKDDSPLVTKTPSFYLKTEKKYQTGTPSFSSWGNKGYSEVWLDGKNDWIYRHIHKAIERMMELAHRFPNENGLKQRALNQAAREVLLSMSSDWPFIMKTGTTVPYAEKRVKEHIYNFNYIYDNLCRNTVDTAWLTVVAKKNNIFPDIDYMMFLKSDQKN